MQIPHRTWESNGIKLIQIPVLADNYIYLLHSTKTGECVVIDPAEAVAVEAALEMNNWQLTHIFNTHHHSDHVGGNMALVAHHACKVVGYMHDSQRIPAINFYVNEKLEFVWGGVPVHVLFLPGHTNGHIAYYFSQQKWLFCGDVLFLMGCGRLFEGTAAQMLASLERIKLLPEDTLIFCAHEYTYTNAYFALSVEPDNLALQNRMVQISHLRQQSLPTVPAQLKEELATNPFLRCTATIAQQLNLSPDSAQLEIFTALREKRNQFTA